MSGLIDAAQGQPLQAPASAQSMQRDAPDPEYHSKVIQAIPPEQRDAFSRLVEAGRKILYAPEMQPEVQQAMAGNKPVWQKVGEGIAKLMSVVDAASKKTAPQELLLPAGLELTADFGAGMKLSPDDLQTAMTYFAVVMAKMLGAPDTEIPKMFGQGSQQPEPAAPAAQPPVPAQQGA